MPVIQRQSAVLGHIYNFSERQRGGHLDTANQGATNSHIL